MRRVGQVIGLKSDQIEAYERLHAAVWPEVLAMISACHMRQVGPGCPVIHAGEEWAF